MTNVKMHIAGNKLIIEIDLAEQHGFTKGRKNIQIATSGGNVNLWDANGIRAERVNVSCWRKASAEELAEQKLFQLF